MIDLTPLDVRKKRGDFRRILRGYDPEEVDTFMELVAERFEELVRQNLILSERTESLEGQLKALEGRESAVQEALVSAQKLREEVNEQSRRDAEILRDQALREAEILRAEADAEVMGRLAEADGLIRERQRALEELERSRLKFLKSFRGLLERELDAVEVEETRRPLEDTTLDLDLRGWSSQGDPGEGDDEDDDEEKLDGFETQVLEDSAPVGLSTGSEEEPPGTAVTEPPEEDDPDEAPSTEEEEPDEAAPTGEEEPEKAAPIDVAELAPSLTGEEEVWGEEEEADTPSPLPEEPKWLFSLLKKEENERGGEE